MDLFPYKSLLEIAHVVNRSFEAVERKARRDGLLQRKPRLTTIFALSKQTGYSPKRIKTAVQQLGISLGFSRNFKNSSGSRNGQSAIGDEDAKRIVEYLRRIPDGARLTPRGVQIKGIWGQFGHPEACLRCGSADKPRVSKGLCKGCHGKETSHTWGIGRRPPACVSCGTTEKRYSAKGLCSTCYKRGSK